jgi:hypothetical protein
MKPFTCRKCKPGFLLNEALDLLEMKICLNFFLNEALHLLEMKHVLSIEIKL